MKTNITTLLLCLASYAFSQNDQAGTELTNGTGAPNGATKRVLIEEATGTWCGFCVRGIVMMEALNNDYPSTTALIAVHNGDPMTDVTYDDGITPFVTDGYPNGLIDRQKKQIDPSDFKTEYLKRVKYVPAIDVFIDKITWNASSRALSFRVNATTYAAFNGSYRFNAVITEMQVHGTTSKYSQHNYYSDGSLGTMGGFEKKPDPVPAADMYYDFVGRGLLDGWDGTANSIPSTNAAGQTISHTYTKTIPSGWDIKNLSVIGFVINSTSGEVENASLSVNIQSVITGLDKNETSDVIVYPNPTSGQLTIKNNVLMDMWLYDVTGSQVLKMEKNTSHMDLSDLPDGIYFLKLNNQKESFTKKIVLLR
jgi:hypothetical protein